MTEHLPALQVVLPLLAGPACLLLRERRLVLGWAVAVASAVLAIAVALAARVDSSGPITYAMGGWPAPIGIVYVVDALNALLLVLVATVAWFATLWLPAAIDREIPRPKQHLFVASWLLVIAGLCGIAITGDAFNVFVFLEIASLASYVLVGLGRGRGATLAAFRYLIAGSLGGTFILLGIGLMYQMTGTLNMADLAARLPAVATSRTVLAGFAFLVVGASLKLALWPLHGWLPGAYAAAPSAVSALLSGTATKVFVYVLLRFAVGIWGAGLAFGTLGLGVPLGALAAVGIVVASVQALLQTEAKRLLAYSSVANLGYAVLALAQGTEAGVAAGVLHLVAHGLTKSAMFLALGQVARQVGSTGLADLRGLSSAMPWTFAALALGGLSLVGVPLTAGFVSKWAIVTSLAGQGAWALASLVIGSSLLALAYVGKMVEAAWFHAPSPALRAAGEAPLPLQLATWGLTLAGLAVGVTGAWWIEVATKAARAVLP